MNEKQRNEIFQKTLGNLEEAYRYTDGFCVNKLRSRLIEINFFLDANGCQIAKLSSEMIDVYKALDHLIDKKLNYYFINLLIDDSVPRLKRTAVLINKELEPNRPERHHQYDLGKYLSNKINDIPIGQDSWLEDHKARSFKGIKGDLKCLMKSSIVSNRSKWIVLTAIESSYFEKNDFSKVLTSIIRGAINNDRALYADAILDSDELADTFNTPHPLATLKAEECLRIIHAYSEACRNEFENQDIDKYPSLRKSLLQATQLNLQKLHQQDFELDKIKNFIEGSLMVNSHKSFTFIHPQNSVNHKPLKP